MLTDPIVLKRQDGTDATYRVTTYNGNSSTRLDDSTTLAAPTQLVISHQPQGKAPNLSHRHLISLSDIEVDGASTARCTVNLTITCPDNTTLVTPALIASLIRQLCELLTTESTITVDTSFLNAILRGES